MVQGLTFKARLSFDLQENKSNKWSFVKEGCKPKEPHEFQKNSKFSTTLEKIIFGLGLLTSLLCGLVQPIIMKLYGEFLTLLVARFTVGSVIGVPFILSHFGGGHSKENATKEEQMEFLFQDARAYFSSSIVVCLFQFILSFMMVMCLGYYATKKVGRMRYSFLEVLFHQEIAWHDKQNTGSGLAATLAELDKLKDGLNENLGMVIYLTSSFISNLVVAFIVGWKLSLITVALAVAFMCASTFINKKKNVMYVKENENCMEASAIAEEVLSSIQTVIAFNGENKEVKRYSDKLSIVKRLSVIGSILGGLGNGISWMLMFFVYAICFWFGTPLIIEDRTKAVKEYTPGVVSIILFSISLGNLNMGLITPYIESLIKAKVASRNICKVFQRRSEINPFSTSGKTLAGKLGAIEFLNIHFSYPSRPDVKVLQGLNLKINQGECVALVGASGSGKSTIIQLMERFYNPDSGSIFLDGVDISDLQINWLRQQIGLVGQEPVLFNTTIAKNICGDLTVSNEDMTKAAQDANVHDFICSLPEGYNTVVGEGGSRFSGGQKQRIAIARALVRKPSILLLDEATSALDVASETIVQSALDRASKGRTTIIVAHRLSTIQNVDRIIVVDEGKVIEDGSHQQLMIKKGKYYKLVSAHSPTEKNQMSSESIHVNNVVNETQDKLSVLEPSKVSESKEKVTRSSNDKAISWYKLWQLNKQESGFVLIGSLGAFCVGITSPVAAVLFGSYNEVLSYGDEKEVLHLANWYALLFIFVALFTFGSIFFQFSMLGVAGARLTNKLRVSVFSAILKQEMAWFDDDNNSVGFLSSRLTSDTNTVQDATGVKLGALMQAIGTLVIGSLTSIYYSWKMTLMCALCVPVIFSSLVIETISTRKATTKVRNCVEDAAKVAIEGISNARTVASLCLERLILENYYSKLLKTEKPQLSILFLRAIVFALGYSAVNATYACSIYYSVYLITEENVPYKNTIIVAESILFGSWLICQLLTLAPNVTAGREAAGRLYNILDRTPQMHNPPNDTGKPESSGDIKFSEVTFAYPKRPENMILKGFNLNIKRGQTIALVGLSGSGKSTCIQILQRFYDPLSGSVSISGSDITQISLHRLRLELGIVSQEPVLFDRTIAENIAYGDNFRVISLPEIIEVAKKANVHDFISSLPAGYDTNLGARGTQLSGGQKQRLAIARALLRNPSVLILDEATSALDTQNEQIVQQALEKAMTGRTCIIIAHRLSTVARCDVIYVMSGGEIVEYGTHEELLKLNKHYARLLLMHQS